MLLLLTACHIAKVSDCVTEEREVADDEVLGDLGFTLLDFLADVTGVRTFPASLEGVVTTAELGLAPTDAPAIFSDTSWDTHDEIMPGLFPSYDLVFRQCEDALTVPLAVDLTTATGGVDLAGEVDAISEVWSDTTQGVGGVSILADVDDAGVVGPLASEEPELVVYLDGPELIRLDMTEGGAALYFPPEEAE